MLIFFIRKIVYIFGAGKIFKNGVTRKAEEITDLYEKILCSI